MAFSLTKKAAQLRRGFRLKSIRQAGLIAFQPTRLVLLDSVPPDERITALFMLRHWDP
jgi:hypothetical protein